MNTDEADAMPMLSAYDRLYGALASLRTVHGDLMDYDDVDELFEALACYIEELIALNAAEADPLPLPTPLPDTETSE